MRQIRHTCAQNGSFVHRTNVGNVPWRAQFLTQKPAMASSLSDHKDFIPASPAVEPELEPAAPAGRVRPRLERRRPERRALFLAEISRKLAESLDYEQTLSRVARLAMPELGAWCIVDLLDETGGIQRLEVIHPD